MNPVDSPAKQRKAIAKGRKVMVARDALQDILTDSYDDDDLYVARTRLDNWLHEQPYYVRHALALA